MSAQNPEEEGADSERAALLALAQSLNEMRDALVETSLTLQDAYFDLEVKQRDAAAEHLNRIMERMNAR